MSKEEKTFHDVLSLRKATAVGTGVDSHLKVLSLHADNNSYVTFGDVASECISNPALCEQGISVSFWMKHQGIELTLIYRALVLRLRFRNLKTNI